MNVHIYAYGDDRVKDAVQSVELALPDTDIYVFDGRYANFPQVHGSDVTPGLGEWCASRPNVRYVIPDSLPFGERETTPGAVSGQVEKARFINYDILPQDEWTIKLDADEHLIKFDVDLDSLEPDRKYFPALSFARRSPEQYTLPRLWKPGYWTFLMNDCSVLRDVAPRDAPREVIEKAAETVREIEPEEVCLPGFQIMNDAVNCDPEYLRSRAIHLARLGRYDRLVKLVSAANIDISLEELQAEVERLEDT